MYEIKLDGYRSIAFETGGKVHLRSRNDNDFSARYPAIAKARQAIPNQTVIVGDQGMPIRHPAGKEGRSLGCGAHGREDDRVPVVETGTGGSI